MRLRAVRRPAAAHRLRPIVWLGFCAILILMPPERGPRWVLAQRASTERPAGPNVLILIGDDHAGGTLGIDGDPRGATPCLDELARQGVRFDHAYCNAPVCTASRQSFITGRLPHAVGVTRLMSALPESAVTLGDWLGDLGYETAAFGKMHFNSGSNHGFRERLDLRDWSAHLNAHPPAGGLPHSRWRPLRDPAPVWLNAGCRSEALPASAMDSTYFADHAIAFLSRPRNRPFAMVVGFYDPHSPFRFPREWQGRYRPGQFPAPALTEADRRDQPRVFQKVRPDEVRGIQAAYYTSLSFMDHQAGRILDALDASGQADNTIVIYMGDNGYMLGQHGRFEKHCFYEQAVRVPLIVRWPGRLRAGRQVTDLVELVDVLPTVLDLARLPAPPDVQGSSLAPLLRGEPGAIGHDVVFSEYLENEEAMVRSSRYKLIVGNGRRRRQDGYVSAHPATRPYERLYDLQADPGETTDLAAQPDLAPVKAELRHRLFDRLVSTRDRFAPVPPGLDETQAIAWCLVSRDGQRFPR